MSELQLDLQEKHLSVKQVFNAPISTLFKYFTRPDLLSQWHAPGEMTVPVAEVDLRVGGAFRISMKNADDEIFTAVGVYKEIQEPGKLVYTWAWEHVGGPDTLVTVLFTDLGDKTEVELVHEGFPDSSVSEHHSKGWTGIFTRLGQHL